MLIKHVTQWCRDYQWVIIAALVIFTIVQGFTGFYEHYRAIGAKYTVFDISYRVMQLFIIESGSVTGPVSWHLELARWLAPLVAVYTAIHVLTLIFRSQFQLFKVRFFKDHVIICGLSRKGLFLAKGFHESGYKVAVIEQNEDNTMIEQCRDYGAIVLIGNAADQELLCKAHVRKAKYLFAVCGDDGVNAEILVAVRSLAAKNTRNILTCFIHIVDPQLCYLLREHEIEMDIPQRIRLEFFNVFESGARTWLNEFPPFDETGKIYGKNPHLLIIGAGRMGENLLINAAKKWKLLTRENGNKLPVSIIDRKAVTKMNVLTVRYPQLQNVCELNALQMEINSQQFERADFLFDRNRECVITSIHVCLDDDSFGLRTALMLHQHVRVYEVPVVVRMSTSAGLSTLLSGNVHKDGIYKALHPFDLMDKACKPELLLAGTHEIIARAIHEEYLKKTQKEGHTPQTNPSMVPWEQLPETLKESNRHQADHIGLKLKAIACGIAPSTDWEVTLFEFTPDEIELMSEMEHERWNRERKEAGWIYAPGQKDIAKKKTPYLVAWDELPEEIKEYDRNTVREIPSFLARAGFQIYRLKHT